MRNAIEAVLKLQNTTGSIAKKKIIDENKDNETSAASLQFPVYVCLRTDKSEASYG